ncbi:MAG: GNAT family N-acetyltransferase [Methylococcales bacterium]
MHIDEANLFNLTCLWKKYGSWPVNEGALPRLHANMHWPHRCWRDWNTSNIGYTMPGPPSDTAWLEDVPESVILSIWPPMSDNKSGVAVPFEQQLIEKRLLEKQWICDFEQIAMYMELQEESTCLPLSRPGFQVMTVRASEDIKKWVDIGSEAFAYRIDYPVIENLINDKSIRILLAYEGTQAVASALLYKTGKIIGIHQVGVKQAFQGQGVARCFMQNIIASCIMWQGKYIVLQASQAGLPLYDSLGFKVQFTIKNYQRV